MLAADPELHRRHLLASRSRRGLGPLILAGVAVSIIAGLIGYLILFSTFQDYDDEGYIMMIVHHVLSGYRLYDEVRTPYGPVYFLFKLGVHGLFRCPLTNDATRFITLAIWLATASCCGAAVYAHSRRIAPAAFVYLLAFLFQYSFANEPGHPQELVALLLAVAILAPLLSRGTNMIWPSAALGAISAALLLVKLNVGVFAFVSLVMVAVTLAPAGRVRMMAWYGAAAGVIGLPWLLMRRELNSEDYFSYVCYAAEVSLSMVAALVASFRFPGIAPGWREARWLIGAFVVSAALAVGGILAIGSSVAGMFDAMVLMPQRLAATFGWSAHVDGHVLSWAVAAALTVIFLTVTRRRRWIPEGWIDGMTALVRIMYGICVACWAGTHQPYLNFMFYYAPPWAYLLLLPRPGQEPRLVMNTARLCMVWLALPQVLQAYPVPGSQMTFGTFLFVPIAGLCLWDGVEGLRRLAIGQGPEDERWLRLAEPAIATALLLGGIAPAVYEFVNARAQFAANVSMNLPGARRLRVEPRQAKNYSQLAAALQSSDTFLCTIGLNSLYFWTGKEPPCRLTIGNDLAIFSDEEQQMMIDSLLASLRPVVVYHKNYFDRPIITTRFFQLVQSHLVEGPLVNREFKLFVRPSSTALSVEASPATLEADDGQIPRR